jgi:shikimate kinase
VEAAWLRPGLWVLEADYAAGQLTAAARAAGAEVVDGLGWLLHQALVGFERMCGQAPPVEAMRAALAAPRRPTGRPNLALVGFMASGKTAVGRALAQRLGRRFVDLDDVVEQRAGCAVEDLFAAQGEAAFRALERQVLAEVSAGSGQVIACGGGAVIDPENRRRLMDGCAVCWLWAPLALCLERAAGSARPLLAGADRRKRALELLTERHPLYAAVADLVVGVEGRAAEGLADGIADEVRHSG